MSKDINFNIKELEIKAKKTWPKLTKHLIFAAVMAVLVIYLLTVWQINHLATAEPSDADQATALATANIPKIDKNAIKQIEALVKTNTELQSKINSARNNPFQE